jgi:hypothetical protein
MAEEYTGVCELCGHEAPRAQMARHLAACAPKHDRGSRAKPVVQLHIEADGAPEYWLYVEGRNPSPLEELDDLLRHVWLECCGHMSAFRRGRVELSMRAALGSLPRRGIGFQYEYDFGSTTALRGKVLGYREGSLGRNAVRLLARNTPPKLTCASCDSPATLVCPFCIGCYLFCKIHARRHPCAREDENVFLPAVNSPRMGVCGYTG